MSDTSSNAYQPVEFYHYSFSDLEQVMGHEGALDRVAYYQSLSKRFNDVPNFVIHNCKLLTTYKELEALKEQGANLIDNLCSLFCNPVTNKIPTKDLSIRQIAELIRSPQFAPQTKQLRSILEKEKNKQFKRDNFWYASFSGTFSYHADINLIQHSGLICMDVDQVGLQLPEVQSRINSDPATVMSFVSPNGDGIKVLYEMDPQAYTQQEYYQAYSNHLSKLCGLPLKKIDQSCSNKSRACFLPHDPNLFIHPYFENL